VTAPVVLIADLFPGAITDIRTGQRPEGVPRGVKLHIILSTRQIAVGWQVGSAVGTWFADTTEEDTAEADHRGGTVGNYVIQRAGGCSCGALLKRWNPYAGRQLTQLARQRPNDTYGLPQVYRR
jgi:predicted RecA/RadA family phage recombinase